MMPSIQKYKLVLLLLSLMLSCTYEIVIPDQDTPKLVVYGYLSNVDGLAIKISKSLDAKQDNSAIGENFVSGCSVVLNQLCTRDLIPIPEVTNGEYKNEFIELKPNCEYQLIVKHPDYTTAISEVLTTRNEFILKLKKVSPLMEEYPSNVIKVFDFEVANDLTFSEYYLFSLLNTKNEYTADKTFSDLEAGCPVFYSLGKFGHIMNDNCLSDPMANISTAVVKGKEVKSFGNVLRVSRVSGQLYQYSANLEQPEGFFTGLELPKLHKSNIYNGLGLFYLKEEYSFPFDW